MLAWMVALSSWRLLGTIEMCMPRELKMTPRKMAFTFTFKNHFQIPWRNSAHFCCAIPNFACSYPRPR